MADPEQGLRDDDRLRQLLEVEQRLEAVVQAARDEAGRRIAEASARRAPLVEQALAAAEVADAEQARAEQLAHAAALAEIEGTVPAGSGVSTEADRDAIDVLARRALARAIAGSGEPT